MIVYAIKFRKCFPKFMIPIDLLKMRPFKSSEHINEKRDGPYRGFGYLSLFSDHLDSGENRAKDKYCNFATFNRIVDTKTSIIQKEPNT